jgi:hypothetical protein
MRIRTSVSFALLGLAACTPQLATTFSCDAGEVLAAAADGGYVCAPNYLDGGPAADLTGVHRELEALDASVQGLIAGTSGVPGALQTLQTEVTALDASVARLQGELDGLDGSVQTLKNELSGLPPFSLVASAHTLAERDSDGGLEVGGLSIAGGAQNSITVAGAPAFQIDSINGNAFVGVGAVVSAIGENGAQNNTALGSLALAALETGAANTAIGEGALSSSASGANNTAVGVYAMGHSTGSSDNTAVGAEALQVSGGTYNTGVGTLSLHASTTGSYNLSVGGMSMQFGNGSNNTAVGFRALNLGAGTGNIAIGYNAGSVVDGGSNNIDIGNPGLAADDGVIRIGNNVAGTLTKATYIAAVNGINVSGTAVMVNTSGQLGTTMSSARYKHEIRDMGRDSEVLLALRPVSFKYKPEYDKAQRQQYGLIAEEVVEVAPQLVLYDAEGRLQTVRYDQVNAMLLNEVQKQRRELDALTARLKALETRK